MRRERCAAGSGRSGFGDDRAESESPGYTRGCRGTGRRSVGVINGEARRSGAVFRRVTPWRSHRSVRATPRNVGRRVRARIERRARPKINPDACQVLAPVAAKRKPIGERWLSPHEELTRGRRTTFGDEGRIGRDAEKIPRQVRPQDPAGKRSCFLCETFSTLLQCVAPFRARKHVSGAWYDLISTGKRGGLST